MVYLIKKDVLNGGARGFGLLILFPGAFLGFQKELGFHRQMELLPMISLPRDRPASL